MLPVPGAWLPGRGPCCVPGLLRHQEKAGEHFPSVPARLSPALPPTHPKPSRVTPSHPSTPSWHSTRLLSLPTEAAMQRGALEMVFPRAPSAPVLPAPASLPLQWELQPAPPQLSRHCCFPGTSCVAPAFSLASPCHFRPCPAHDPAVFPTLLRFHANPSPSSPPQSSTGTAGCNAPGEENSYSNIQTISLTYI